ncbi:MAG: FHIPEP family type III secretion protein, partial [Planctomycetota bacterium]
MRETASEARIVYRADFLVAAGAAAVLAGLLFPLRAHILDVLLIFSICLTAAIVLITFSARSAVQVQSFPLLIVVVTCLRVASGVACAKLLLVYGRAGTLVNVFGELIVGEHLMLTVLVFCLLATITLGVTFRSAKRISRTAAEFASDIVPTRQASLETALGADIISESQARGLETRTGLETGFFAGMNGAATFMLCCVVAEFVIIIVDIVGSLAVGASTAGRMTLRTQGTLAVGAGAISIISIFTISAAASHLVRKSFISSAADDWFGEFGHCDTERIPVAANEVASAQASASSVEAGTDSGHDKAMIAVDRLARVELRVEPQSAGTDGPTAVADMETYLDTFTRDAEWLKEEQTIARHDESEDRGLWAWQEIKDDNCYELIAELIENRPTDEARTVLMAAECVDELPVTVPVNAAMRLSHRHQRCLLIDLDWERDAIAKVFDDRGRDHGTRDGACEIP